jgi:hypothetical protein
LLTASPESRPTQRPSPQSVNIPNADRFLEDVLSSDEYAFDDVPVSIEVALQQRGAEEHA